MLNKLSSESLEQKIKKYLSSDRANNLLFVNTNNNGDYQNAFDFFNQCTSIVRMSDFCHGDDLIPNIEEFYDTIQKRNASFTIVGFTQFMQLSGEEKLLRAIDTLLDLSFQCKTIVLCFQAEQYFEKYVCQNPRLERQIIFIDGEKSKKNQVVFIGRNLAKHENISKGIKFLLIKMEDGNTGKLLIATDKLKMDYKDSLLPIQEIKDIFDGLKWFGYNFVASLEKENGTSEQWSELLEELQVLKTFDRVLDIHLGTSQLFNYVFSKWTSFSDYEKWLFFIGIKVNGGNDNNVLQYAADNSHTLHDFHNMIYRGILDVDFNDKSYNKLYSERKDLLHSIDNEVNKIVEYCNCTEIKGKNAIHYLTDNTEIEKIKIIECLAKYNYSKQEIVDTMTIAYPALASYLKEYHFGINLLDNYFQEYKFQKITNRIYKDFLEIVNKNAKSREYLALLPYRSEKIESINKDRSLLYFVDALGVEFLGYLLDRCKKLEMSAQVTVCHSNFPSITSLNKEFLNEFDEEKTVSIKELDQILHHGKEDFDYQKQKYPIYIIRELEIIDEILKKISSKILSGKCDKVIIVADHGASRLAVINENVFNFDVDSKGTHGGRCCAYDKSLPEIPYAIREHDYYVLASYDRFKGGRAANIETHGGATLEEVVVPIIEVKKKLDVEVVFTNDIIKVSNRKKAEIEVFANVVLSEMSLIVNGKHYSGKKINDRKFIVKMPDIKKAGDYLADVYSNNNPIANAMKFRVEKEGFAERELF